MYAIRSYYVSCDGDAMIAIHYEIHLPHFVHFDGRQTQPIFYCGFDACPTTLVVCMTRQEGARELGVTPYTPHNGIERNVLQTALSANL